MTAINLCKKFGISKIRGMAYMPGPSNYEKSVPPGSLYENSDFYNNIFEQLWGYIGQNTIGRRDLSRFQQQLGVNFIHCYDWASPVSQKDENGNIHDYRSHVSFLKACNMLGMKATVPISNYTMDLLSQGKIQEAQKNFNSIINEVYTQALPPNRRPIDGVGMWKIFNEYELWFDRDPKHVVTVMTWIKEWEQENQILEENALPVMVCTSFGMSDGIEGAGYMKNVRDAMLAQGKIGRIAAESFWNERVVFATNPQNDGPDISDYLKNRLPKYWNDCGIPAPPVMFTELGSSIVQTGGETQQAEWLSRQLSASTPGSSNGMMLGACVFLNEERPWEDGPEKTFGILRFGPDTSWQFPAHNYEATTSYPQWDPKGWWWEKSATFPVEQQAPKLNYQSVRNAWKPS